MYSIDFFNDLKSIYERIKNEETGSRKQFAKSLKISENKLWRYLQIFKSKNIPVKFSKRGNTYFFDIKEDKEVRVIWEFGVFDKENN